jgi:hypothetical protein
MFAMKCVQAFAVVMRTFRGGSFGITGLLIGLILWFRVRVLFHHFLLAMN